MSLSLSLASYCDALTEEFRKDHLSHITFKCEIDAHNDEIVINSLDKAKNLECIRLKLHLAEDERIVEVSLLSRCMISGDEILQNVIRFAKKENFLKCTLQDASTIFFRFGTSGTMVDISLKYLNMLSQGETWYGKKGFKNEALEQNQFFQSLKQEIKKPIMELVVEIFPHVSEDQAKGFQQMCAEIVNNQDMTEDMCYHFDESIQSYFQRMKTFLQTFCPNNKSCDMKYLQPCKQLKKYTETAIFITTLNIFFKNGIKITKTQPFRSLCNELKRLFTTHVFSATYELPLSTIVLAQKATTATTTAKKRKRNSGSSSSSSTKSR